MSANPTIPEALLREIDEQVNILVLVTGTLAGGGAHYAYASIPPSRYQAFKAAEAKGNYDLAEYGTILRHGSGRPTPQVCAAMEEEYGANHRFEEELVEAMRQALFGETGEG